MDTTKLYCPHCRSPITVWKAGFRAAWRGGKIQQYLCKVCNRRTVNPLKRKPRVKK